MNSANGRSVVGKLRPLPIRIQALFERDLTSGAVGTQELILPLESKPGRSRTTILFQIPADIQLAICDMKLKPLR